MATIESSRSFWEQKARENAFWYISSFGSYHNRDEKGFWDSGLQIWNDLKRITGYLPRATDVVVDIGCGIGRLTRAIAADVGHVHGVDISAEMIRRASELKIPNATFHVSSGCALEELPSRSANYVLAYNTFQHLPDHDALRSYLHEMKRVAAPGGQVVFTTCTRDWRVYLMPILRLRAWLLRAHKGPTGLYKSEWTGIRSSRRQVLRLCPIALSSEALHQDKWLFYGSRGPLGPAVDNLMPDVTSQLRKF